MKTGLDPAHKSLSNTSRMTKKLNESFEDSLRIREDTKASLEKSPNAPKGTLLRDLWSG